MEQALALITAARAGGQQVTADVYPYVNNGLGLESFLHPRHAAQGAEGLRRKLADPAIRAEMRRDGIDRRLGKLVQTRRVELGQRHSEPDQGARLLGACRAVAWRDRPRGGQGSMGRLLHDCGFRCEPHFPRSMSEANVVKAMRCDFISFCTDMGPILSNDVLIHPRGSGAFPSRVLGRYVREFGIVSLERAIARMTSVAANDLKLYDRGRITPGAAADLVVFAADRVGDRSTFAQPTLPSAGIVHVLVNGRFVIEQGKTTTALPGKVLRRPGSAGMAQSE